MKPALIISIIWMMFAGVASFGQEILPFPDPPMGGKVGPTMQQSVHKWREQPRRHLDQNEPTTGRQGHETAIGA